MDTCRNDDLLPRSEMTCASLLQELNRIWDEVGESEGERDEKLLEIERECLGVYKKKVQEAEEVRTELRSEIAAAEVEVAAVCSALGETTANWQKKVCGNLKEEVRAIKPRLEEMRRRREERELQFLEVESEIARVSVEIFGPGGGRGTNDVAMDGTDLSMDKLDQLRQILRELLEEKSNRQKQVEGHLGTLRSITGVLGVDYKSMVQDIHCTLAKSGGVKDISDDTIRKLVNAINSLREVKKERLRQLQLLATSLLELWILLETPSEEQHMFQNVINNIAASEAEITEPNALSSDIVKQIEAEVTRLERFKLTKVKEIFLKKRLELEEICRKAHLVTQLPAAFEDAACGGSDKMHLLEEIDVEIEKAKTEALSRKEILDKVEKWLGACEEECWLEEYSMDQNRYNAGRGAHLALKRAEKARVLVNKLPAMVDALTSRILSWEEERGIEFMYDGVRLVSLLEEYNHQRQERERERERQRDQKKLQVQLIAEHEAIYGSKPSPTMSAKKAARTPIGITSNRKLSLGGPMLQNRVERASSRVLQPNKNFGGMNENNPLARQLHTGVASQASGKRISEIPGRTIKKQSSTTKQQHTKTLSIRKPLSPVPSSLSFNTNIPNFQEDPKEIEPTLSSTKTPTRTPTKWAHGGGDENRTPTKLPMSVPITPATVSAPMLMAATPATPFPSTMKAGKRIEQVEYSFEELRAGFVVSMV